MLKFKSFLLVVLCLQKLNAQIPIPEVGVCSPSPVISDFDITKYVGLWYEIERQGVFFEENVKCITANYKMFNSTAASVDNESINKNTGQPATRKGYALAPDSGKPNHLLVYFTGETPAEYNIWKSDYSTYSLVYTCKQIVPRLLKLELIWILSKQKTLDETVVQDLKSLLEKSGVNISKFQKSNYEGCN